MQGKLCAALAVIFISPPILADSEFPSLDLEELMATDIQTTSAMKRVQKTSETAASLYVLTNKELIMSGVTSVAQALSLVPGVQVRRIDSNQYAITTRAVAGRYSSKTLVMIDGQSIYNPSFAGVYWEALDVPIYDIARIEVIRGQGGLLWGSNATNGVINIITKHTEDTRGTLVQAHSGSDIEHKVNFRSGGDMGNRGTFRVYGSSERSYASDEGTRIDPNDTNRKKTVGGRMDLSRADNFSLLFQGQYSDVETGQGMRLSDPDTYETLNVIDISKRDHSHMMMRAEHRLSDDSNQMLQASWSRHKGSQAIFVEDFVFWDVDYQMNTKLGSTQFDWGLNYRYNDLSSEATDYIESLNNEDDFSLYGAFVQAQFEMVPDKLKLILGNKSEHNTYTGWEHQPMAKLIWHPEPNHVAWASLSQGVRIPSLLEYDRVVSIINQSVGSYYETGISQIDESMVATVLRGTSDAEAERSFSKEIGYRYNDNRWSADISLFHTDAKNVLAVNPYLDPNDLVEQLAGLLALGDTAGALSLLSSSTSVNQFVYDAELESFGGEVVLGWQPADRLKAEVGYSYIHYDYDLAPNTVEAFGFSTIVRQAFLKGRVQLTDEHSFYSVFRVEDGEAYSTDDFTSLDLSWNWQIDPTYSFSLTGNNLLYSSHQEYANTSETFTIPTYIERSVVARVKAEF